MRMGGPGADPGVCKPQLLKEGWSFFRPAAQGIACVLLAVSACGVNRPPAPGSSAGVVLLGRVLGPSNEPVTGAEVGITPFISEAVDCYQGRPLGQVHVRTDRLGAFRHITSVSAPMPVYACFELRIKPPRGGGYAPNVHSTPAVLVQARAGGVDTVRADVRLSLGPGSEFPVHQTAAVEVQVVGSSGQPLPCARVLLRVPPGPGYLYTPGAAYTDHAGRIRLGVTREEVASRAVSLPDSLTVWVTAAVLPPIYPRPVTDSVALVLRPAPPPQVPAVSTRLRLPVEPSSAEAVSDCKPGPISGR
jgi:hypothetical protein